MGRVGIPSFFITGTQVPVPRRYPHRSLNPPPQSPIPHRSPNRSLLFPFLRRRPSQNKKQKRPLRYRTQAYVPPGGNHLTATRQYLS